MYQFVPSVVIVQYENPEDAADVSVAPDPDNPYPKIRAEPVL
jgi:hypothetical protein